MSTINYSLPAIIFLFCNSCAHFPERINPSISYATQSIVQYQLSFDGAGWTEPKKQSLTKLIQFLVDEFGSPNPTIRVLFILEQSQTPFPTTTLVSKNRREIRVPRIALSKENLGHAEVVHELFHGLYQTHDEFLTPRRESEMWPSYAQFRYQFRGLANLEIKKRLMEFYKISEADLLATDLSEQAWKSSSQLNWELLYLASAWPLFNSLQVENAFRVRLNQTEYTDQ